MTKEDQKWALNRAKEWGILEGRFYPEEGAMMHRFSPNFQRMIIRNGLEPLTVNHKASDMIPVIFDYLHECRGWVKSDFVKIQESFNTVKRGTISPAGDIMYLSEYLFAMLKRINEQGIAYKK